MIEPEYVMGSRHSRDRVLYENERGGGSKDRWTFRWFYLRRNEEGRNVGLVW